MAETNPFANAGADAASLLAQTAEQPVTFEAAKALTSKGDHDAAIDGHQLPRHHAAGGRG